MQMTGAEIMVKVLAEEGVTTVFGYPGGAILPFYDALRESPIEHILTAHEQGAAHAADGFARASGKVGVCIATSGPGATNLVTGLATAFLDSTPVVAITGQVNKELIGHDAFQEVDITGITMPITKHNFLVKNPENLAQTMRLAFQLAKEGRPGPVLIDVPRDVQTALIDYVPDRLHELPPVLPDKEKVQAAVDAINKALRPVMLIGGGVISADAEYDAMHLCEKLHIPVVSTLMGLGAISAYRSLFLGMTGLHGHERANNAIKEADLILAVGSRFNDRVTGERKRYSANKTIIHLDIDPAELDKNIDSTIGITGNMNMTLNMLEKGGVPHDLTAWWDLIATWPDMDADFGDEEAPAFFKALNPVIKDKDYIITTDVGQHQMWAAQHIKIQFARQLITSGGLGTMGFGLPAAMGAQLARPKSRAISLSGDGGFKMTGSELFTIASNKIPVIAIVFNNSGLGMIRQLQTVQFNKRFTACELPGYMDFVKYAEAFGIKGEHVDTPEALAEALTKAMAKEEPYVIEVAINPKNMVQPMVAPGLGINDYVKFVKEERITK
ncbi:biosynthetic-type acetolactate synthase large subunit [Phascolarctobacterium sp.]|uniref:biosynthetic-type acetolactate synthase large subunit n=1 Tax=Phascolarctobacterium sp. TaxID=2049039 RepID=UPI00386366D9